MNPKRISKIIKHTGILLKEVLSELFGKKEESDDTCRDQEPD
jgi:hypothetical protein